MSEFEPDRYEDVIHLKSNAAFNKKTFIVEEFVQHIVESAGLRGTEWFAQGVQCRYLAADGGGWQEGRMRISIDFVPQSPTEEVNDGELVLPPGEDGNEVDLSDRKSKLKTRK